MGSWGMVPQTLVLAWGMDAGRRNNRGIGWEAQSQRPAGSVENKAECQLEGFPLSERRASVG